MEFGVWPVKRYGETLRRKGLLGVAHYILDGRLALALLRSKWLRIESCTFVLLRP